MKVLSWNVRGAHAGSDGVWVLFRECAPDVALLQESRGLPDDISAAYHVHAYPAVSRNGGRQSFSTAVLLKGDRGWSVRPFSNDVLLDEGLQTYAGNLVHVRWKDAEGKMWNMVSCYSPAWPLFDWEGTRRRGRFDGFKSVLSDDLWLTDFIHRYAAEHRNDERWVVAGDFNSATTFSWEKGQNQEVLDNMGAAGLDEAVRLLYDGPVPTFRHSRGSVKHQLDHFYLNAVARQDLVGCRVLSDQGVFEQGLSDHLPLVGIWS